MQLLDRFCISKLKLQQHLCIRVPIDLDLTPNALNEHLNNTSSSILLTSGLGITLLVLSVLICLL